MIDSANGKDTFKKGKRKAPKKQQKSAVTEKSKTPKTPKKRKAKSSKKSPVAIDDNAKTSILIAEHHKRILPKGLSNVSSQLCDVLQVIDATTMGNLSVDPGVTQGTGLDSPQVCDSNPPTIGSLGTTVPTLNPSIASVQYASCNSATLASLASAADTFTVPSHADLHSDLTANLLYQSTPLYSALPSSQANTYVTDIHVIHTSTTSITDMPIESSLSKVHSIPITEAYDGLNTSCLQTSELQTSALQLAPSSGDLTQNEVTDYNPVGSLEDPLSQEVNGIVDSAAQYLPLSVESQPGQAADQDPAVLSIANHMMDPEAAAVYNHTQGADTTSSEHEKQKAVAAGMKPSKYPNMFII